MMRGDRGSSVSDERTIELWHVYSTPDGESHMRQVEVPVSMRPNGHFSTEMFNVQGATLRRIPAAFSADWHPISRRQLIVTISGEGEVETSDGAILVSRPGVVELLEDFNSKGHLVRGRGSEDRVALFIAIDDDVTLF
jgi:hypothetical protein